MINIDRDLIYTDSDQLESKSNFLLENREVHDITTILNNYVYKNDENDIKKDYKKRYEVFIVIVAIEKIIMNNTKVTVCRFLILLIYYKTVKYL